MKVLIINFTHTRAHQGYLMLNLIENWNVRLRNVKKPVCNIGKAHGDKVNLGVGVDFV